MVVKDVIITIALWVMALGLASQFRKIWTGPPPGFRLRATQRSLDLGGLPLFLAGLPMITVEIWVMALFATTDVGRRCGLIRGSAPLVVEDVTAALFFLGLVPILLVALFNRPRTIIPPYLRNKPGWVSQISGRHSHS